MSYLVNVICGYLAFLGLGEKIISLILSNNIAVAEYYPLLLVVISLAHPNHTSSYNPAFGGQESETQLENG